MTKVWINKYIKRVLLKSQSYDRDGQKLSRLSILFIDGDEINIDLVDIDFKKIREECEF